MVLNSTLSWIMPRIHLFRVGHHGTQWPDTGNFIASREDVMEEVEVNVQDRILRPVSEVFGAIIDPAKMSGYFISRATGPMKQDAEIEWNFDDVGARLSVEVKRIEENRLIMFD